MEKAETKGAAFDFYGKLPLTKAVPLGLQHVLAMFVGNLTPILIITGACGIGAGSEFAELQVDLLQNAMLVAGIVTLVQLYAIGPVGERSPLLWEPAPASSVYSTVWQRSWAAALPATGPLCWPLFLAACLRRSWAFY